MDRTLTELANRAQKVSNSDDPQALVIFRTELAGYFDLEQPCPAILFDGILNVLKSAKLASYSEFGDFLTDLAISDFAFTGAQREELVKCVAELFFNIDQPICRMQACHLFFALQSRERSAHLLLRLLQTARKDRHPQAEIIWELASLKDDSHLAPITRDMITRSLPTKS